MVKKFFSYIFSRSNPGLFLSAFFLSLFLTVSGVYLLNVHTGLILKKDLGGEFTFSHFTLLGKFYAFSGIIPSFLLLILIFRLIKFLLIISLKLVGKILSIIFSDKNLDKFFNKIKLKKKVKKDYLMPLSIIIAATILAIAILFQ